MLENCTSLWHAGPIPTLNYTNVSEKFLFIYRERGLSENLAQNSACQRICDWLEDLGKLEMHHSFFFSPWGIECW